VSGPQYPYKWHQGRRKEQVLGKKDLLQVLLKFLEADQVIAGSLADW